MKKYRCVCGLQYNNWILYKIHLFFNRNKMIGNK